MSRRSCGRTAVVVFARVEEAEAKALSGFRDRRARLSELLLRRALETVGQAPAGVDVVLSLEGHLPEAWTRPLRGQRAVRVIAQRGEGFEARLLGALAWARDEGYQRLVAVGIDTPGMSALDLRAACESSSVVLGPSVDGGFYLLGLDARHLERLRGLPWCTPRLLAELRLRFADLPVEARAHQLDLDRRAALAVLAHPLHQLALRMLGAGLERAPVEKVEHSVAEPRSWRARTGRAPRGPPRAA